MLCWSSIYLVIPLIAFLFGFINIAASIIGIAKVVSLVFLGLFLIAIIIGGNNSKKIKG